MRHSKQIQFVALTLIALITGLLFITPDNATAGPPAQILINNNSNNQTAAVGDQFVNQIRITVLDASNQAVSGATVTFVPPASGPSASFPATTFTTNGVGRVVTTATAINGSGSYNVAVQVAGVPDASLTLYNATPPFNLSLNSNTTNQSTLINTAFANDLRMTVTDANGRNVGNAEVTLAAPGSGASALLSPATIRTNALGRIVVGATANNVVGGPYNVVATVTATGDTANFVLTNASPANLTVTKDANSDPQSTLVNTAFAERLSFVVTDSGGNPVEGLTVTFSVPGSGASANLSTTTTTTNTLGRAITYATANGTDGSYQVTGTVDASGDTVQFALTNAAPAGLVLTLDHQGDNQSTLVNTAFTERLSFVVTDGGGNPIEGLDITFTAPGGGASAGLSATTTTTNALGRAITYATANGTVGSYQVTGTVDSTGDNVQFNLSNFDASTLTLDVNPNSDHQVARVNDTFAVNLTLTVTGPGGHPVDGVTVDFTAPSSGPTAIFTGAASVVTNTNGRVFVGVQANNEVGFYTVTATVLGETAEFHLENSLFDTLLAGVSCSGDDLVVNITGGDPPFDITGSGVGLPLTDVPAGSYTLTGAASWDDVTITEDTGDTQTITKGDFTCPGADPSPAPFTGLPVPNHGRVMIGAGQNQPAYSSPGGDIIVLDSGPLLLPADSDGSGADTYTVADYVLIGDDWWVGLFIGSSSWVWVPLENVTPMDDLSMP